MSHCVRYPADSPAGKKRLALPGQAYNKGTAVRIKRFGSISGEETSRAIKNRHGVPSRNSDADSGITT